MPKNADGQTRWLKKHLHVKKNQDISMTLGKTKKQSRNVLLSAPGRMGSGESK